MTLFATAPPPPECAVCHAAYDAWLAGGADETAWWEEAASGDADVFGDSPAVEASSGDAPPSPPPPAAPPPSRPPSPPPPPYAPGELPAWLAAPVPPPPVWVVVDDDDLFEPIRRPGHPRRTIPPPSAPPAPPPAVASPPPTAANKIGYLSSMQMGDYEYRNVPQLGGKFTYNYRSGPSTQAEFDYINANNVEYIPNVPHKWLVLENNNTINGWTRPSGTSDVRCYFSTWGLPQPDWPKDYPEYAGSSICTTQDFVDVLQANQDSFVVKPRRLLLQNEPWVGAVQPKSGTELADFYKNDLEPALAVVPMDVVLHTSKKSDKCLTVDIEFLKRCDDIGCNFDLATEWSLHHYSQETQEWIDYYTWDTGE